MERHVKVLNKLGLHSRPAAALVKTAGKFASEIRIRKNGREVSGKSILGVMMLAAAQNTELTLIAEGPDAQEALDTLQALFDSRFGEDP